ncbi:MAG: gliding motility-associated C-terminal domain-containing protein [Chitinophagaceae bacterium]|nr:gliding motility-associated C-terminal domain-containing protein [Chitinophagaceae bacterium]
MKFHFKAPSMKKVFLCIALLFCISSVNTVVAQSGVWTWMKGSNTGSSPGNYGVKGVSAPTNEPPARYQTAYWTDQNGDFWLFGGVISGDLYNDLWKYTVATNEWTWMSGAQAAANQAGVSGTQGVPSVNNYPSARGYGANCWTDNNNNLWLFAGYGYDNIGGIGALENLWKYNIATNEWTWVNGSLGTNPAPIYGTQGVPAAINTPGGRAECKSSWVDPQNNFWIFGGQDAVNGVYNDMWKYDIATNQWTFMKGDMVTNGLGNYGTKGVEAPANLPPSRLSYTKWEGLDGSFYIFAGGDFNNANYNDVWKYNPSTNNWTWTSGSNLSNDNGLYNQMCDPNINDYPHYRIENQTVSTLGCTEVFWSFGGFEGLGATNVYNDLWLYNTSNNTWTWVSGSNAAVINPAGNFGVQGVPAAANMIPCKGGVGIWTDKQNNLWVFGGFGTPGGNLEVTNDLWRFQPDTSCFNASLVADLTLTAPSDTELCPGESTVMTGISPTATISWWPAAGATPNADTTEITFSPGTTTTYTVAGIESGKCPGIDTIVFTIYVYPNPIADFVISPNPATIDNPTFTLTNTSLNAVNYDWHYQGVSFSTQQDASMTVGAIGTYCFTLYAYNQLGCMSSTTNCAEVVRNEIIYIPNAFSPNGDFVNNTLKVKGENFDLLNFEIYDRWGELLFKTDEVTTGWDGNYKGKPMEVGTYFYMVEYSANGKFKMLKGDIALIR